MTAPILKVINRENLALKLMQVMLSK